MKVDGEPGVCELADAVGVTPSTISLQLKTMCGRGIEICRCG
ncbi:ArsR family transcriptional regulator [Streptomyces fractus]